MPFKEVPWYELQQNINVVILWMVDQGFTSDDIHRFMKEPQAYPDFLRLARPSWLRRLKRYEKAFQRERTRQVERNKQLHAAEPVQGSLHNG